MTWEEACCILGVPETATCAEIKEQYFYKVQLLHPDKNFNKPEKVVHKAEEELAKVNEAYKFLIEPRNNPGSPPTLEVVPRYIRFTDVYLNEKKSTTIEIKSAGGPFTNIWIDNSPAPWVTVTDVRATASEPLPLSVTVEAQALPAIIRPEQCSLLIRLKNEKSQLMDEVAVGLEIVPQVLPARLRMKNRKIKFQDLPQGAATSSILEIGNSSREVLHGFIATQPAWLSVSQSEIILPRRTISRGYSLCVDTENLPAGFKDTGFVSVCTNGGELTIPVELSISRKPPGYTAIAPNSYSGNQAQSTGYATKSAYTAYPGRSSVRQNARSFWFLRFILVFAITFSMGLVVILLFSSDAQGRADVGSIWGWAALTFLISLFLASIRK